MTGSVDLSQPHDLGSLAYFEFASTKEMAAAVASYRQAQGCTIVAIYRAAEIEARYATASPPPGGPVLALPVGALWVIVSKT